MWIGTNWQLHALCFHNIHRQRRTGKTAEHRTDAGDKRGRTDLWGGSEDRQMGGHPGIPQHFFQNPADDTVTTSLPIKDIPRIFFF